MKIDKKLVFKGNYLNLRYFWRKEKSLSFEAIAIFVWVPTLM